MNPTAQCRTEEASHREDILEDPSMEVQKQAPRLKVLGDGLMGWGGTCGKGSWDSKGFGESGVGCCVLFLP